jgi:hypothetical protein
MINKTISVFAILILAFTLTFYKNQQTDKNRLKSDEDFHSRSALDIHQEKIESNRSKIEKMAQIERSKLKVMVEHDNSPITNSFPVILDASGSYDPDMGDEIKFTWKQLSGPKIKIMPDINRAKVSFEGTPGEYTFELIVIDNYGAENKKIKTVIIDPEPNMTPIIKMKIRQGSELK